MWDTSYPGRALEACKHPLLSSGTLHCRLGRTLPLPMDRIASGVDSALEAAAIDAVDALRVFFILVAATVRSHASLSTTIN